MRTTTELCRSLARITSIVRGSKTPWKAVLAAHWDGLAAADFFTVEVLTLSGLVRDAVLFVMKLKTRTVEIAGITYPVGP